MFININIFIYGINDGKKLNPSKDKIYINGWLSNHLDQCKDIYCPCKLESHFDSKKKVTRKIDKKYQGMRNLLTLLLKKILDGLMSDDYINAEFYNYYSEFIFFKFRNPIISLKYLKLAEFSYPSSYQSFKIYLLRRKIFSYIKDIYQESCKKSNFVEEAKNVLDKFEKIKKIIFEIYNKSLNLWTAIANSSESQFKDIKNLIEEILDAKHLGMQLWTELA